MCEPSECRLTQAESARCLESWVAFRGLASHQLDSFDRFVKSKLQEIVLENSEIRHLAKRNGIVVAYAKCTFQKVHVRSPCIREADGTLHLVVSSDHILKVLRITGLDALIPVDDTLESALAASVAPGS